MDDRWAYENLWIISDRWMSEKTGVIEKDKWSDRWIEGWTDE